jgi:hypothetical protein
VARLRYNNQAGTLGADPGSGGTTLTFASAPDWATIVAPDYIPVILDPGTGTFEIVYVTAFTVGGTTATMTRAAEDGTNWPAVAHPGPGKWAHGPIVSDFLPRPDTIAATVETANYTLALTDIGSVVEMNSASGVTLTVPTNASVAFPVGEVIQVCQIGVGQVTIAPAAGVVLHYASSLTTRAQYSTVTLRQRAANEWVVGGDAT